jgi:hypothetical protein
MADAGLTSCLPLNAALLVFHAGLFRSQKIWEILPDVGIYIKPPDNKKYAEKIKTKLDESVTAYYKGVPGHDYKLSSTICTTARRNLEQAGIRKLYDRSSGGVGAPYGSTSSAAAAPASLTLIEKVPRGYDLDDGKKDEAETTLSESLATPPRKNGAETGTLQPLPLGLGCTYLTVVC